MSEPFKIAAIVLAAGRSKRMGSENKLVSKIGDKALVRAVVENASRSNFSQIIIVTGYQSDEVTNQLVGLDVTTVVNDEFAGGMSTSLKSGVLRVAEDCDGAMVLLGDMPFISSEITDRLIAGFGGHDSICLPVYDSKRGNPVLWGSDYFSELTNISGDIGARELLVSHQDKLSEIEVGSPAIFRDFDRPEDFEAR